MPYRKVITPLYFLGSFYNNRILTAMLFPEPLLTFEQRLLSYFNRFTTCISGSVTCYLEPKLFKRNARTGSYASEELWLPIKDITTTVLKTTPNNNNNSGSSTGGNNHVSYENKSGKVTIRLEN